MTVLVSCGLRFRRRGRRRHGRDRSERPVFAGSSHTGGPVSARVNGDQAPAVSELNRGVVILV
jgi:hypothetical protein